MHTAVIQRFTDDCSDDGKYQSKLTDNMTAVFSNICGIIMKRSMYILCVYKGRVKLRMKIKGKRSSPIL